MVMVIAVPDRRKSLSAAGGENERMRTTFTFSLTDPIASIMDCIVTNACERRRVGLQRTKLSEIEQNKVE